MFLYISFYCWGGGEPSLIKNTPLLTTGKEEVNDYEQALREAKEEFEGLKDKFHLDPSKYMDGLNPNFFKSLINGLFQSEGLLSIYFQAKSLSKGKFSLRIGGSPHS